jgi:hypothetical protein
MSVEETLITAGAGLVVGLLPFGYAVRRDRREAAERAVKAERDQRGRAEADERRQRERAAAEERRRSDKEEQALERRVEQMRASRIRFLDLLGKAMVLLEAVLVDADNADELLWGATDAMRELQGHAQGDFFALFEQSPAVLWADSTCRDLLGAGLEMASAARAERQTGSQARETQDALRRLTLNEIDATGPRDLFRWASLEAVERWPQPLATFDDPYWTKIASEIVEHSSVTLPPPPLTAPPT